MIMLKNCRLIPALTEGFEKTLADVIIDDEKILRIEEPGTVDNFDGKVIDAEGNTLLPGFFDLHAHLYATILDLAAIDGKNAVDTAFDSYLFAREYLCQGYTTIRDAGSPYNVAKGLMKARDRGIINVPDIIASGHALTPTENGNDEYTILYRVADGADEMRKAARKEFEAGNDIIKVMATGAFLNESGQPGQTIMTEDEMKAVVEIAKMKDSYVMAHAHGADGIKMAIRCGARTVEHCCFVDEEAIAMFKASDDCFMIPTGTIGITGQDEEMTVISEGAKDKNATWEDIEKSCVNKAYRAGLKMGFGSDADYAHFVKTPGLEFISRREYYDFDCMDILLQATKNSAEIAGLADKKGTICVGKNAELVIVEGNPDEDMNVMKKKPKYVFFRGEIIAN